MPAVVPDALRAKIAVVAVGRAYDDSLGGGVVEYTYTNRFPRNCVAIPRAQRTPPTIKRRALCIST